jgi:hypothetical protein
MKVSAGNNRWWLFFGMLIFVLVLGTLSAAAQGKESSNRIMYRGETHVGQCCTNWADPITITEPYKLAPIIVTWSLDYQANAPVIVGLRVNDGPCGSYGPGFIQKFEPETGYSYAPATFQWVIMPGDYKLVTGKNVIRVCGGGEWGAADTKIELGFNTLNARLEK